jgi:TP901 family phage tail tape measure protein
MALERVGLGGRFEVDTRQGVKALGQGRDAMGRFTASANRFEQKWGRLGMVMDRSMAKFNMMGAGLRKVSSGIMNLGFAMAPLGLVIGGAIKKAADFEHQMSAVGAIARASSDQLVLMTQKAEQMGIKTAFTATESAQAMELLAIAGADVTQIMAGVEGVTDLAAASGTDLARSADIVAQAVKIMRLEWSDTGHVADVFSLASVSANTTVHELGEGMKFVGTKARSMGIGLEETVATLSRLADAGLKGSMGGTGLMNMLVKLSKPTAKAKSLMEKWNISLDDADGSFRNISAIVADFHENISKIPSASERARIASEIFGIRGERAYNALAASGKKSVQDLEAALINSMGTAAEMAGKRLDNFLGKMTLFKSSLESLAIGIFTPLFEDMSGATGNITDALNGILFALKILKDSAEGTGTSIGDVIEEVGKKFDVEIGNTTVEIAKGMLEGINIVKGALKSLIQTVKDLGQGLRDTIGESGVRSMFKFIVSIGLIAGALTPVLLSLFLLKFAITGIISLVSGLGTILAAAFWPITIVLGAAAVAVIALRNENQNFFESASTAYNKIKLALTDLHENVLKPIWAGIRDIWIPLAPQLSAIWLTTINEMKTVVTELFDDMHLGIEGTKEDWTLLGNVIGFELGGLAATAGKVFQFVAKQFKTFVIFPIRIGIQFVRNLVTSIKTIFAGDIIGGLKELGLAILDFFLAPVRQAVKWMIELADLIGKKDLIPEKVITFAEKGITGLAFGDDGKKKQGGRGGLKPLVVPSDKELEKEFGIIPQGETETDPFKKYLSSDLPLATSEGEAALAMALGEAVKEGSLAGTQQGAAAGIGGAKTEVKIDSKMCVDGEALNVASARHSATVKERSGEKFTPWQRRTMVEHGAIPVTGNG